MENNLSIEQNAAELESLELLCRFILSSRDKAQGNDLTKAHVQSTNIVIAAFYFRRNKSVNDFITKYLEYDKDYFHIQWIRSIWAKFETMSDIELSELVINEITSIDNIEQEQ